MPEEPVDPAQQQPSPEDAAAAYPSLMELAQLLPQYEMHEIVGIGGMGAVYKARQIALDRWAAIKVLPAAAAQNPEDVQRFIKEARAMAKLVHPHIVAVFDFGQTYAHHLFLVMEFVEGCDLHHRTRRGEITKEKAREVIAQLCDALQFAHDRGVAHRDIKPANILITNDWKVKVADFGLARDLSAQANPDEVEYGTPDYTAPERLIIGAPVDHRADIYSLGVVIHEMLTGKTPTAAGKDAGKDLPEGFASVISKCLMSEPEQRYQKASEVKVALLMATAENKRSSTGPATADIPATTGHVTKHAAASMHELPESLESYSTYRPSPFAKVLRLLSPLGWAAACVVLVIVFAIILLKDKVTIDTAEEATPKPAMVETSPVPEPENKPEPDPAPASTTTTTTNAAAPAMASAKPTLPEPGRPVMVPAPTPAPVPATAGMPFTVPDGEAGEVAKLAGHESAVNATAILGDQRRALSASSDGTLRLWDLTTQKQLMSINAGVDQLARLQVTPDEKTALVYGYRLDKAALVDLESGTVTHSAQFPNEQLVGMVYAPELKVVVAGGSNTDITNNLWVWKPGQDEKFSLVEGYKGRVYAVALLPGGREAVITASELIEGEEKKYRPSITRFAPDLGSLTSVEPKTLGYITRFFGKAGEAKALITGSTPKVVTLPDLTVLGSLPAIPREGPHLISGVLVDGDRLVLTSWSDSTLRAYEITSAEEVWRQEMPRPVTDISLSKDQRWAVLGTRLKDGSPTSQGNYDVLVWRLPKWQALQSDASMQSLVDAQMPELEKHDAELADLRQKLREHAPLPERAELEAGHQKLDTMYVTALKRDYARLSPTEQQAYREEIEMITQKKPLPDAGNDFTLVPPLQKMRGIYRQQLETLQNTHAEAVKIARESVEKVLGPMREKRNAEGDRAGALRVRAVLREWSDEAAIGMTQNTSAASSPPTSAATSTSGGLTITPTKRPAQAGSVITIQRKQVNSMSNVFPPHIGLVPRDLGPVVAICGGSQHMYALLPDGQVRGWGTGNEMGVPGIKDVVQMDSNGTTTIVLMADGKVTSWMAGSDATPNMWTPATGQVPVRVLAGNTGSGYIVLSNGSFVPVGSIGAEPPAADMGAIKQLIPIPDRGWCALRGRDGTPVYWGDLTPPVLPLPGDLRDLISISIGRRFGVALQRDGTMTGWGEIARDQRYRVRKLTAATKVYHDYADRVFPVHRADHSWELAANPNIPEYEAEDNVGLLEGRLRGAIDAVFGSDFVVMLRP